MLRLRSAAFAIAVSLSSGTAGCRDEAPADEVPTQMPNPPDGTSSGGSSGSTGVMVGDGSETCLAAPVTGAGSFFGSLGGRPDGGVGACGQGGPALFFRIGVEQRSDVRVSVQGEGFEPRVGVFGNDCALRFEDAGLLCTSGVPGWVSDVPAGSDLWVAVGGEQDAIEASPQGAFRLDVQTRRVLPIGEGCANEAWGRCEGGSVCTTTGDGGPVCTPIPGDRCGNALDLSLGGGTTVLSIEPDAIHTDAHRHSCGGDRVTERVYRVELPAVSAEASLSVEGERVLALAARGPTCLDAEEVGCDAQADALPSFTVDGPLPPVLYLFVELPAADTSELSPGVVRLRLEDN